MSIGRARTPLTSGPLVIISCVIFICPQAIERAVAVVVTGVVVVVIIAVAAAARVVVIVAAAVIAVVAAVEGEATAAKMAKAVDTAAVADTEEAAADTAEAAGIVAIVAGGETTTMIATERAATKEETNIEPPKRNNLPDNPVSPLLFLSLAPTSSRLKQIPHARCIDLEYKQSKPWDDQLGRRKNQQLHHYLDIISFLYSVSSSFKIFLE